MKRHVFIGLRWFHENNASSGALTAAKVIWTMGFQSYDRACLHRAIVAIINTGYMKVDYPCAFLSPETTNALIKCLAH